MIKDTLRTGANALAGVFFCFFAAHSFAEEAKEPCLRSTPTGIVIKSGKGCAKSSEFKSALKAAIADMNAASQQGGSASDSLSKRSATGDALYRAQSLGLAGKSVSKPYYGAQ